MAIAMNLMQAHSNLTAAFNYDTSSTAMDNGEMDIDMDIDIGAVTDDGALEIVRSSVHFSPLLVLANIHQGEYQDSVPNNQPQVHSSFQGNRESLSIDRDQITPQKIHIQGVDDLTTEDLKTYSVEHYPTNVPSRIEWIDDTSANIVYESPEIASGALESFLVISSHRNSTSPFVELHVAKTSSVHPESRLQVRLALITDQKRPRAYEASRFYMLHPEYDPRENRRRKTDLYEEHGDYRRRRYGDDENRRRRNGDDGRAFNASMYDDDAAALAERVLERGKSDTITSSENGYAGGECRRRKCDRYRPGAGSHRSRDRSASPERASGNEITGERRSRRRTPPPNYSRQDPHPFPQENHGKELFPPKLDALANGRELFPNKHVAANLRKELFPSKSGHRRSDAIDAANETADLFANGMSISNSSHSLKPSNGSSTLADRVTNGSQSTYGRLKDSEPDPHSFREPAEDGFKIKDAAKLTDQGFSIRGLATEVSHEEFIKELFPNKAFGNAGKELFAERLQGRSTRRNRAEDLFY